VKQVVAISALGIRTIPQRLGSSAVAVIGIAGVVVVLVSVLSIAEGFRAVLQGTGGSDRAIVMRSGSDSEMTSVLLGPDTTLIKQTPGVARDDQRPIASAELFVIVDLPKKSTGTPANVPLRGVDAEAPQVRREFKLIDGRMFQFGTNEVVVGRAAMQQFSGLDVGAEIRSGRTSWKIVGAFEAGGSVLETEIWCDARILQGFYQRGDSYQTVLARLESAASFKTFKDALSADPRLSVDVQRENEYYAGQSTTLTNLIRIVGFGIAGLMSLGAIFTAILTMYTAVATRAREIATLRALGFSAPAVIVSVIGESLALGLIGGVVGGAAAYLAFNGYQTSTMNFQTFSQVAFAFRVTPQLLIMGIAGSLMMGFIGGLFPAFRAATQPIPSALREL
jgi:putative ABC transport system permease protein